MPLPKDPVKLAEYKRNASERMKGNKYGLGNKNASGKRAIETCKNISESRKGKPSYIRTKEIKDKCRKSQIGRKQSKETIEKAVATRRRNNSYVVSQQTKDKLSKIHKGRGKGRKLSKEHIEKLRISHRGKIQSEETKLRNSISNMGRIPSPKSSYGKHCYYESLYQGKIHLRSSYELVYAKYLDSNNKDWLYESMTFKLENTTYTPDFYLIKEDKFIEIKGWLSSKNQIKINNTIEKYKINLEILFKEDLLKLGCIL